MINFDEYIRNGEPDKKAKASAWKTAIGLQAVDGLHTSDYLKNTATRHIEGDISMDEVKALINGYYQSKTIRTPNEDCLKVYSNSQAKSVTTISQRENGCFAAIPCCTPMQKTCIEL